MDDRTKLQWLTCRSCDRTWVRKAKPHMPPTQCPDCRPEIASPGVVVETGTKCCARCRVTQDVTAFYRQSKRPDGRNPVCRTCLYVKPIEVECTRYSAVFGWVDQGGARNRRMVPLCPPCRTSDKHCMSCKTVKPLSEFAKARDKADGRVAHCRECAAARYAQRDEVTNQALNLRRFKLTVADYNRMLASQDGACAICRTPKAECPRGYLAVDHDHACCDRDGSCGQCVRALLCTKCNIGIGMLQDDRALLLRAVDYLTAHQTVAVPTIF